MDVYRIITERIVGLLEQGVVPWHRPWGGPGAHPKNLVSGKEYRGVNSFMLSASGYKAPWWVSYKQAGARGGQVKKGEHGFPCVFWNWTARKNGDGETKMIPFLRYYTVFNVEQCTGLEYPKLEERVSALCPIEICESVVRNMPNLPRIERGGDDAFYDTFRDYIRMPTPESFESPEKYYATLYHELSHSTGHHSRLARFAANSPHSSKQHYSREELLAEMGSAFLCGHTGIENNIVDDSASYIHGWLGVLKGDSRLVVQAASGAQKAADYILNERKEVKDEMFDMPETPA